MTDVPSPQGDSNPDLPSSPLPSTPKQQLLRWQRSLQKSSEPIFFLNSQGRLAFVNEAWQSLTRLDWPLVRARKCKKYPRATPGSLEAILSALTPPPELATGKSQRVRRFAPRDPLFWWDLDFFPIRQQENLLGILGKITPIAREILPEPVPLPSGLANLRDRHSGWYSLDKLSEELPFQARIKKQILLAAQNLEPVWLVGEAGVGKHWLARLLHGLGLNNSRSLVTLDGLRSPASLCLEMLFGTSGLLSRPQTGSLYIHAPEHLPTEIQDRLVDWQAVVQRRGEGEKFPRILVGATKKAKDLLASGNVLERFYLAFSVQTIEIPPLRQRKEEFDNLTGHLLYRIGSATNQTAKILSPEAREALLRHAWPGNIRELFQVLREACFRTEAREITWGDLPLFLREVPAAADRPLPLDNILADVERRMLALAMAKSKNNKSKAAEILGISRPRLIRRLRELGLEEPREDTTEL